jgi:hypothetical protein
MFAAASILLLAAPSVYPTGTTIYDPWLAWSGFTVLSPLGTQAAIVIDMDGNLVKQWDGFVNSAGGPARIFPGGVVMAASGTNVYPLFNGGRNSVYRAYRVPYSWIPQIAKPNEKAITPPAPGAFRMPQ